MMRNRIVYFDVLNVVSCFSVVCLHCNGYVHSFVKDEWWWLRVLIEVAFYFAVPVFFMLSGATLFNFHERYSISIFYKKRIQRTLIPFLFWGCVFYAIYICIKGVENVYWKDVIENFSSGHIPFTNYWFFIPLFALYIFIPFLSLMVLNVSYRFLLFLIILLFTLQSFIPTLYEILNINIDYSIPIGGAYLVYALLGYYLSKNDVESNNKVYYSVAFLAVISLMIRYLLIYYSEEKTTSHFTYMGLYVYFPSIFVFMTIKRYFQNSQYTHKWKFLSSKSLGVYLIHTFLIALIVKKTNNINPFFVLCAPFFIYCCSIAVVTLFQRFKFARYLMP